jgi:ubiquinone/menaquinone biosynthesis C-methylase UbiE
MSHVQEHFDREAERYDDWKKRNAYYYDTLKDLYRERIQSGASVLEVGCGTGDLLAHVNPSRGVGIDVSSAMIDIARRKHPDLEWHAVTTAELCSRVDETFDVVFLSDVVEHLENVPATFRDLRQYFTENTQLIVNMANPLWEPVLMVLEKLRLKMPEGPHKRISASKLNRILEEQGFALRDRTHALLCPAYIPVISMMSNACGRVPGIRRLCLIEMLEYRFTQG